MGSGVEAPGEIFHHGGDAAAPPALGEDEVAEQETQRVADIEPNGSDTRAIGDTGCTGEGPGTEAGHEATEARDQPGNAAAAAKIFGRAAVEAHNVKPDPHHEQRIEADHYVVNGVGAAISINNQLPYTLFSIENRSQETTKERNIAMRCYTRPPCRVPS